MRAALATLLVVCAFALVPVLSPAVVHALLDRSGSAAYLQVTPDQAHRWSDRTVAEVVAGWGRVDVALPAGPLYSEAEEGHLADVRLLFRGFALVALLALVTVLVLSRSNDRRRVRRDAARGAVAAVALVAALGAASVLGGFDRAFDVFHRVFFPQGNYAFAPDESALVRLYPPAFWQLFALSWGASVVAVASALLAALALAGRHSSRGQGRDGSARRPLLPP